MNFITKEKPYNTLTEYNKYKYKAKVAKIALNGNFTCPNSDGKKGYGGCTFCSNLGSGDLAGDKNKSFKEQFNDIKSLMVKKWPNIKYIPYLQANSNTYASLDKLKEIYSEVISLDKDIVGISIATRADCIDEEIANYLGELNKKLNVEVELGLQTVNENTGILINRCTTNEEFIQAVKLLRKYNIEVIAHIINGLPNETTTDMLNTIDFINSLDIQGVKFHSLLILKNTKMYEDYKRNPFHILSLDEYVKITALQICHLKDNIIIHRLAADGVIDDLVEPKWTIRKMVVMNEIDKYLRNNNLYQGIYYKDQRK